MQAQKRARRVRALPLPINLSRVAIASLRPRSTADRFRRGPRAKRHGSRRASNHHQLMHFHSPLDSIAPAMKYGEPQRTHSSQSL